MSTSTTSISATKGEKGKSKYAALNINNLYKGNSIEPQAKTVAPKHGMQSLGKVPSARRAPQPVNLPSLKSESGGSGQETSTPSAPNSQNPGGWTGGAVEANSTTTTTIITTTISKQQQQPVRSQSPLPASVAPAPSAAVVAKASVAPVQSSGPSGTAHRPAAQSGRPPTDQVTFLDRKFQQDFPSLTADINAARTEGPSQQTAKKGGSTTVVAPSAAVASAPGAVGPPTVEIPRQESPQPLQYGPGPSLRPQTEGSWVQGGRGPASHTQPPGMSPGNADGLAGPGAGAIPQGPGGPGSAPGGGPRGGPTPGHLPTMGQGAPPPHALRSVMPPFMFRGGQIPPGATGSFPAGYQGAYGPRGPSMGGPGGPGGRYPPPHAAQDSRYQRQGPPRLANQGDTELYPRPIIKEEDLRRMDEISGDDGWAAMQDEPDYDRKLFEDEDEVKERKAALVAGNAPTSTGSSSRLEEEIKVDRDGKWADNIQAQGRAITLPSSQNAATHAGRQGYQGRPLQSQQLPSSRAVPQDEDEFWREQRRQQKDEENKAAQRAKERREEEERRFEQTKMGERGQREPLDSSRSNSSGRDRDNRDRERDRDRQEEEYVRRPAQRISGSDRGGGGDRYDFSSRHAPSQSQIPPRFLKQKQHQTGAGGRSEEDVGRPSSQQPKEIRLPARDRERDDRGPTDRDRDRDRDRGSYDSRGDRREWRDDRDIRDSEPVHSGYKRSYDNKDRPIENWSRDRQERDSEKRSHHQRSSIEGPLRGEWSDKDTLNGKRRDKDVDSDVKDERPNSRDSRSSNRETSVSKDDSSKDKSNAVSLYSLDAEIVSWADEPADDEAAPLAVVIQSQRGYGEDGRSQASSKTGSHSHHPTPVPISRDKLEADVSREPKSNFVPLRRMQNQSQQPHGSSGGGGQTSTGTPQTENDADKKNRPAEVENVWASRSKSREQQQQLQQQERDREQSKADEKEGREEKKSSAVSLSDKSSTMPHQTEAAADGKGKMDKTDVDFSEHDVNDSEKNKKGSSKDNQRTVRSSASAPVGSRGGSGAKGGSAGASRRGGRGRAYDDYYEEENGSNYKSQDVGDDRFKATEMRKSKSPSEEDRDDMRKERPEDQRNRGSAHYKGGRRGQRYEDEEIRSKEGQQQRAPRFQQHDEKAPATASSREKPSKNNALTQQTSQDSSGVETWETHSEHSGGDSTSGTGRFNRRGRGGVGGNSVASERRGAGVSSRLERGVKPEQANQVDYSERHKESDAVGRESTDSGAKDIVNDQEREDKKLKETKATSSGIGVSSGERFKDEKGRPAQTHLAQSQTSHSDDSSGPKRARKDDGQQRKEGQRGDDRRFQRPVKSSERFDNRPKSNLPPRLARLSESGRFKHSKADNELPEGSSVQGSNKDGTPPPQQTNPWEKSVPATSSGSGNGGSISLTSDVDRLSNQTAALIIDDSVTDRDEEKPILDGTTPPVQTIIFENTNFKSSTSAAAAAAAVSSSVSLGGSDLKGGKCTPPGQPQQPLPKTGIKVQQPQQPPQQQQSSQQQQVQQLSEGQKTSSVGNLKSEGSLQMPMAVAASTGFNQGHHSAGLQLPVGSKVGVNRGPPMHHHVMASAGVQSPISPSTAELNMKIASVKKVWEREMPSMPTVLEHYEDSSGATASNSSAPGAYPPPFDTDASGVMCASTGDGADGMYSHSSASPLQQQQQQQMQHQQQQMQQHQLAQQQAKMDVSGVTNVCKVKPQQQNAITLPGQISSSPTFSNSAVPVCNASSTAPTAPGALGTGGPLGYHPYGGMPAVPSPPAMVFGSAAAQQIPAQPGIYQPFLDNSQFSLLQVLNPNPSVRSQFSQYIGGLSPSMGQLSNLSSLNNPATAPFGQQNILFQQPPPPSPAAPPTGPTPGPGAPGPAPPVAMSDMYPSSVSTQYRLQSHGHGPFGQSQPNAGAPMLISGNNSLGMKSSSYGSIGQPNYGSIGTKTGTPYQQQPSGHQHSQVYFPFDPSQQVINIGQVNQMSGQSYLQNSQLLQQRTAPPPVQTIQPPPPSSYYSAGLPGAGAGSNQTGFYQPTGAPNLQHQVQVPPAGPSPFSLPGFASQTGLQGFASRNAQQQQPPSQQLNQLNMNRYRNGPNLQAQGPAVGLGGLQFNKPAPSPSGASPAPNSMQPSAQYNLGAGGHVDSISGTNQGVSDLSGKMDNGHPHVGPSTSPKSRHKSHHHHQQHHQQQHQQQHQHQQHQQHQHQQHQQHQHQHQQHPHQHQHQHQHQHHQQHQQHQPQLQQQQPPQPPQQQQMHQPMNKFPGSSNASGAYPGPPSVIRSPGFPSVRTGPPPPQGPSSGNNGGSGMIIPGGSGSSGNAPRYPTPIQRPTAVTNQNSGSMSQIAMACGPPGTGLGVRPRAPNPHPARIPGTGTAPGQPQIKSSAQPSPTTGTLSQPFPSTSSSPSAVTTTTASSVALHASEPKLTSAAVTSTVDGDQQQRKGNSPSDASETKTTSTAAAVASASTNEAAEKESNAKGESAASK